MPVSDGADEGLEPGDAAGCRDQGEPGVSSAPRAPRLAGVRRAPAPPADPTGPSGRRLLDLLGEINRLEARFAAVCRTHHTTVHEHRWNVKLTSEGQLKVKPP